MNIIKKFLINLFQTLFCLFMTGDIIYNDYVFYGFERTIQMKIYMALIIIIALANWIVLFSKVKIQIKLTLVILSIFSFHLINLFPDVRLLYDFETCLDMGNCSEEMIINIKRVKNHL